MNEEEMDEKVTKIIKGIIGKNSNSSGYSELNCNKISPDWEPTPIYSGNNRYKELHKKDLN